MLYTEHKILISNDTIKSSPDSTRPKIVNLGQYTKALIIKEIRGNATNEIMPILNHLFSWFIMPISLSPPFLTYSHFPDFQYIAQIFRPSSDPPIGSRFQVFGLLLKNANWFIINLLAFISFSYNQAFLLAV